MKISMNQMEKTIDRGPREFRDIKFTKVQPMTGDHFAVKFCAVLIALIFAIVVSLLSLWR
jgi:hypothetical protein